MEVRKIILLSLLMFCPKVVFGQNEIQSDDVIIIAPDPPFLESGIYSRIANYPYGIHLSFSGSGYKNYTVVNYSTDFQKNDFLTITFSSRLPIKAKYSNVNNPALEILGSNFRDTLNYKVLIYNRFYFGYTGLSINTGVGYQTFQNNTSAILNLGIRKNLNYDKIFDHLVSLHSFVEANFFISKLSLDWAFNYHFEFYNRNYKNLSFSLGYGSIFGLHDILLNVNYKYYFFNRKAYNL